ncbi:HDOD domain-containing protein [Vibrio sp. RC27]
MNHVSFFWLPENKQAVYQSVENEFSHFLNTSINNGKFILPPIPSVVLDIQRLCTIETTTVKDVADCLIDDPSLTAIVLRIANSVIFNRRGIEFKDIHTAVSRLGIMRVRDIVTAQSIEQIKYSIQLDAECDKLLRDSAIHSRELGAVMVLVTRQFQQIDPKKYAYLEHDKSLIVGLLADIGLFCILSEYHLYLEKGNYIDSELSLRIFETACPNASYQVLNTWGFDQDFLSVARNKPLANNDVPVSYLDIAKIAYHLLLFRNQDEQYEQHEVEINTAGAEVLYELSNLTDIEFDIAVRDILNSTGF